MWYMAEQMHHLGHKCSTNLQKMQEFGGLMLTERAAWTDIVMSMYRANSAESHDSGMCVTSMLSALLW